MKKLSVIFTLILVSFLVSCSNLERDITITFDAMGGSDVPSISIKEGKILQTLPIEPVKEGYRFEHWYKTIESTEFDFSKAINNDITLKAYYVETVTLTFDTQGGSDVDSLVIDKGTLLRTIPEPVKDGFVFDYWYTTDENIEFDFISTIDEGLNFTAAWDLSTTSKITLDIDYFEEHLNISDNLLYMPTNGNYYNANISYDIDSQYISENGVILSLTYGETVRNESLVVTFRLDGEEIERTYNIQLTPHGEISLVRQETFDFTDLSTEFEVADTQIDLFFELDGSVPYVKITDFFDLLEGFIDPELEITEVKTDTSLTLSYEYYDADVDETYVFELVVDSIENTFTTSDPGFYWAYVYSTVTNYGRNIEYLSDNPAVYNSESDEVVYDLDLYNMDIVMKDGEVVVPYYIANQLFVGPSYYNVYYNNDGLFGIYLLPETYSAEYDTIHASSVRGDDVPADLVDHTFNMLAFDLDYLYGLKDIMGIDSYYDLLFDMKDDLLTTDANDLDQAIADLLRKEIDEPHTSYGYMSYYATVEPTAWSLSDFGSRFSSWYLDGLIAVDDVIGDRWGITFSSDWNALNSRRPDYWFLDENTAMLTLNDFNTYDLYESTTYDDAITADILKVDNSIFSLPSIVGDYFYFYNSSTLSEDILEMIVKCDDSSYVATYMGALETAGFSHVTATSTDLYKTNGYFTKDITLENDEVVSMFVLVSYNEEYDLFYVGVAKEVPTDYYETWPVTANVEELVVGDSAVYMEETLENIMAEQPTTTNVILDLSWNTGGNVGALYRVLGYTTDQPFMVSGIDRTTNSESTYVVSINKPNPYTSLNWSLLTTKVTFSAANSMTKIFMENDIGPVIGVQTGGGACSITPILLPNGTAFTTSSNNISAIRTGTGTELDPYIYTDVEFGVIPDNVINLNDIYNATVLLGILAD